MQMESPRRRRRPKSSSYIVKPQSSDDERAKNHDNDATVAGKRAKYTVLVVDDDPTNLRLARVLLESEGFSVVTATDALSTFEALKTADPAVILMDIQLPGMDGWELTRRLKKNIVTSHIPVIALTAYGKHGDEDRARDAGFAEFVAKPVSTRELPAIIRKYLRD